MSQSNGVASLDQDNSDINAQDQDDTDGKRDEPNEFEDIRFATHAASKGRRVGKGKRSSAPEDAPGDVSKKASISRKVKDNIKVPGTMAVLPGIDKCFVGARLGAKGLRGALAKANSASIEVSDDDLNYFNQNLLQYDPMLEEGPKLIQRYLDENGVDWLTYMDADFNILIYGFGYKKDLILKFIKDYLNGSKVLAVHGSVKSPGGDNNRGIKVLLDGICSRILKQESLWSQCQDLNSYVKLICENLNKLYGRESQDFRQRYKKYDDSVKEQGLLSTGAPLYDTSYLRTAQYEDEDGGGDEDQEYEDDDENIATKGNLFEGGITSAPSMAEPHAVGRKRSAAATVSESMSNSSSASTGPPDPNWGGRYSHIQGRLYIIVFDLDGECLQSPESQSCMSLLAACSSVSIIASVESVNAPLLWSPQTLFNYRWMGNHMPTYQSYPFSASGSNTPSERSKEFPGGVKTIKQILTCLTERHTQLVNILVSHALKHYDSNPESLTDGGEVIGKYPGIYIEDLLEITNSKLIARNMSDLDKLLYELISHKVICKVTDPLRKNYVCVSLTFPVNMIRELAKQAS